MKENSMYRRLNCEFEFERKEFAIISRALDLYSNQFIDIFLLNRFPKRNSLYLFMGAVLKRINVIH